MLKTVLSPFYIGRCIEKLLVNARAVLPPNAPRTMKNTVCCCEIFTASQHRFENGFHGFVASRTGFNHQRHSAPHKNCAARDPHKRLQISIFRAI
jgi:hypothetical protein